MTDQMSKEEFDALVKQAGLTMTPEDADKVKTLFDNYSRLLGNLRAADLDDEEVAGIGASTMGSRAMAAGMTGSRELLPPISLEMRAVAFLPM